MEPRQFAQVSDLGVQRAPTPTPSAGPQGGPAVKHAKGEGCQGVKGRSVSLGDRLLTSGHSAYLPR